MPGIPATQLPYFMNSHLINNQRKYELKMKKIIIIIKIISFICIQMAQQQKEIDKSIFVLVVHDQCCSCWRCSVFTIETRTR